MRRGDLSTDALLRTEKLTKRFGGLVAVDHLDFAVSKGELRCIIGPNGSGKTTFLNLITGSMKPSEGRIFYKGRNITGLNVYRIADMGIGRKFQMTNVYENLTVRQNLEVACLRLKEGVGWRNSLRPSELVTEQVSRVLRIIGLMEKSDSIAASLSHGEKQWLEIGMVLAIEPELLLLDEPTAGMTKDERTRTGDLIKLVMEERNKSTIIIEHDIEFVRDLGGTITVLHKGAKIAEGSFSEIDRDEQVRTVFLGRR